MHKLKRIYWYLFHRIFISADSVCEFNDSIVCDCSMKLSAKSQCILGHGCELDNCQIELLDGASLVVADGTVLRNTRLHLHRSSCSIGRKCHISDFTLLMYKDGQLTLGDECVVQKADSWRGPIWEIEDVSVVHVDHHTRIRCDLYSRFGSTCEIGCYNCINEDTEIRCDEHIKIGNYNMISYRCRIWDTDTHSFYQDDTRRRITEKYYPNVGAEIDKPKTKSVVIGSDNLIGEYAAVLKGTNIGSRCKIGFRSIVSNKDVPDGSTFVGGK